MDSRGDAVAAASCAIEALGVHLMLVLIVEDNPMIALDLEAIVVEQTQAQVVVSSTVASTQGMLDQPFDFAFFDVDLPDGTTYGLASEMLARHVPLAFVSGSSPERMPHDLRRVPFISKPFLPRDVMRVLRRMPLLAP